MNQKRNQATSIQRDAQVAASQNFLTSRRLLERIVRLSGFSPRDKVLEIGTGKGHLTSVLCEHCGHVTSVEIDGLLCRQAARRLAEVQNVSLLHGDFMHYALPQTGDYKVFANIPYYLTTAIVDRLTSTANPPTEIWLVMEKGAARRFLGSPRENPRSLTLKTHWEGGICYSFRREDFHPMPSVDSVLLKLCRKAMPDVPRHEQRRWVRFITTGLKAGFEGSGRLLSVHQANAALRSAGLPPLPPGGDILYIQWLCLFRCWCQWQQSSR